MIREAYEGDARSADARPAAPRTPAARGEATAATPPAPSFETWWAVQREALSAADAASGVSVSVPTTEPSVFTLPSVPSGGCTPDTWSPTRYDMPDPRSGHTAVWTGTEMIVWGGQTGAFAAMRLDTRRPLQPGDRHVERDQHDGRRSRRRAPPTRRSGRDAR